MEVIRVRAGGSPAAIERFEQLLKEAAERLHTPVMIQWNVALIGPVTEITAYANDRKPLVETVAAATAQYMMETHEKDLVRSLIADDYGYDEEDELAAIEAYCWHNPDPVEQAPDPGARKRLALIQEEVTRYLEQHRLLHVEGFIRFRLQRYIDHLREIVEYAIDEYTADKQYEEFISLLKYFVYIQDAKIPVAHLIHKGAHEFALLNDRMEPIETKQLDQFVVEMIDKEINYEDMIVSTLITVSPQNVYIHTRNPEMQVIKTIKQIFEERATVCTTCPRCIPLLGDCKRHDQYYR
jgi:putative sporulation protein YtxC